jgi:competence protein ComEC
MRAPLAWIVVFGAAGAACAEPIALSSQRWALVSVPALLLFACCGRRPLVGALLLATAVFGAGAASLARELERARGAELARDFEGVVEARVLSRAVSVAAVELVLADLVAVEKEGAVLAARAVLRVARGERSPVLGALPGEAWRLALRLRRPPGERNPGASDRELRLARAGIGALARLRDPALAVRMPERDRSVWRARIEAAREAAAHQMSGLGPGGGLLLALALGDRRGVGAEVADAFAELGLSHLVAVSGLNVGVAAALARALVFALLRRSAWLAARIDLRNPALAVGLTAAAAFSLLAGFGIPVRRALFFLLAALAAARRPTRRAQPLWLAAALVIAAEPGAIFDPGAQLSFAASAALLLASRRRETRPRWIGGWIRGALAELLATTALAGLATAPIAASHFGRLSAAALPANLVGVPWVLAVLFPASLGALLWAWLPEGLRELRIARAAAELASALADTSALHALELARALPELALAGEPRPATLWIAAGLAYFALRFRATGLRVGLALLQLLWLAFAPGREILPAAPRLVALDVGHGDALIVQGRRSALLVDAGAAIPGGVDYGRAVVLPALRALGVLSLDVAVASHADLDHRGGLASVLRAVPVGELWLPPGSLEERAFAELIELGRERGVRVRERAAAESLEEYGDLRVEVLWPPPGRLAPANDRSLVLRVRAGDTAMLLTGDIEGAAERALVESGAPLGAEVLKLAHHGSRSSSGEDFLAQVGAELAIVSAACAGRFGMPHPEVRRALDRAGVPLAWTGRDGALIVALDAPRWLRRWNPRSDAECSAAASRGGSHSAR